MAQDFANSAEVQRYVEQHNQLLADGAITQKEYNAAINDVKVGLKGYTAQLETNLNQLKQSVVGYATNIVKGEEGASLYNNTITSAGTAISSFTEKWGFAGKAIGMAAEAATKYVAAVNVQADELFKQYKDISRTGLVTGMDDVFTNLQSMGYTMKEIGKMGALLKENSDTFAVLGGTAAQGAKEFANLSREIQYSDFGEQLQRMGMSTDEINKGAADYLKIQRQSGTLQTQSQAELVQHTKEYLLEADRLTKITGQTRAQQNKVVEDAMAGEQYAATQTKLRSGSAEAKKLADRNDALIKELAAVDPGYSKALQKYLSGFMTTDEAIKFKKTLPEAAKKIDSGNLDTNEIMDSIRSDSGKYLKNWNQQAQIGNAEKTMLPVAGAMKLAAQAQGKSAAEADKMAKEDQAKQRAGADKGAKNMVEINNAQRNQTMVADKFINKGVEPVTGVLSKFTKAIEALTSTPVNKLIGGEGKVGEGPAPGGAPTAPAAPGGAPATPAAPSPGASLDKTIEFGGNTGDRAHFDKLDGAVRSNFIQMAQAYNESTGKKLRVNSAFRSPEEQAGVQSGNNPKAAPGKSLHNIGKAIDINTGQRTELASMGLLGKYGFSLPPFVDPPHIQMPSAATGGIIGGPKSGYQAMLHGTEAVVPLPDGKTIPVQVKGGGGQQQTKIIALKIGKMDVILRGMQKFNDTTTKILQRQS
jgi:hypothetical protein